jgi:hypothetical protein
MDQSERGEHDRNKLRGAIAEVALRVTDLSAKDEHESVARRVGLLEASWQALMPLIQLEPEPTRRECPHCHCRMRQAASRCLYCLGKSLPPDTGTAGAA